MGANNSSLTGIYGGGMYVDVELNVPLNAVIFSILLCLFSVMALSEVVSVHFPYSKFAKPEALGELPSTFLQKAFAIQMNSRLGMFILYFVPLLCYVIIWAVFASENVAQIGMVAPSQTYSVLLFVGWCLAFGKRCFEVLFVHVYSGKIPVLSSMMITGAYSAMGLGCAAFANQVVGYTAFDPFTRAKDICCVIFFCIGITVNFISHYQLRAVRIRQPGESADAHKKYYSPSEIGWLFKVFVCPHYIFEIVMYAAWSIFGATSVHYILGLGVFIYLSLRTRSTHKWYIDRGIVKVGVQNDPNETTLSPIKST